MPVLKDSQLNKACKDGDIRPIYFLYGEETHLLRKTVDTLIQKTVAPAFEQFNLQQFEGNKVTLNQIEMACEALPMMAEYKCVTVKNWNTDKLLKADYDALLALADNPNPSTVLILFYTEQMIDSRKKTAKQKKLLDLIAKNGVVCEFALKDRATLRRAIQSRCKQDKVAISAELCDELIEHAQSQYAVILNELEKLVGHAGPGGTITRQSMDALGIASVQGTAFDLSNAILQNNYEKAFGILDRLFYLRMEPVMVMGALIMSFVDLYRLKAASLAGCAADQVITDFSYRSKYRIQKLSKDVGRFSPERIRSCIDALEKADRMLKSSRVESRLVMEQMLGEMMLSGVSYRKWRD